MELNEYPHRRRTLYRPELVVQMGLLVVQI